MEWESESMKSLQDLCVNTIIDKFKFYNRIYYLSEDVKVKHHFEFLKKKFSATIVSQLDKFGALKKEYLDFLLNKYLKYLHTDWFLDSSWETIHSKFAEIGANLTEIHIHSGTDEDKPWQDVICYLPNLEKFSFCGQCHKKVFKNIAKYCPNIVEISLDGFGIVRDKIKALCPNKNGRLSCQKLKKLFVGFTIGAEKNVSKDVVKHLLKNLPSLEETDIYNLPLSLCEMHKRDLSALDTVKPYKLTSLDLRVHGLDSYDHMKICLSLCPHLKQLWCLLNHKEQLNLFSKLTDLEFLDLHNTLGYDINVNNLLRSVGGRMKCLFLHKCAVSVSVLAETCIHLERLALDFVSFTDEDSGSKLSFPYLKSIRCHRPADHPASEKALMLLLMSSSPKLGLISLSGSTSGFPKISHMTDVIANCPSLKNLTLNECCLLQDSDAEQLFSVAEATPNKPKIDWDRMIWNMNGNLVKVHFRDSRCLEVIPLLPNVEVLHFEGSNFDNKVFKSIAKHCPNIEEIDLRNSYFVDGGIAALCSNEGWKVSCSKLKRLFLGRLFYFRENGIFKHLLRHLPSLELSDCPEIPRFLYELHRDDLSALDRVEPYKLTSLDLLYSKTRSYDHMKICLSLCPRLKELSCPLFMEEQLDWISKLSHLDNLYLSTVSGPPFDVSRLLSSIGRTLTSLGLEECVVSLSALVRSCARLKSLSLRVVSLTVDDKDFELSFPRLEAITISLRNFFSGSPARTMTAKDVKWLLSSSPKAKTIVLSSCRAISPEMETEILNFCMKHPIKYIDFTSCRFQVSFLRDIIVNCRSLKCLGLWSCHNFNCFTVLEELCSLAQRMPNNPTIASYKTP